MFDLDGCVLLVLDFFEPLVLQAFSGSYASFRILVEHLHDEIFGFVRYSSPVLLVKFHLTLEHLLKDLRAILALKRRVPAKEDVEDDAEAPYVARLIIALL